MNERSELRMTIERDSPNWKRWMNQYTDNQFSNYPTAMLTKSEYLKPLPPQTAESQARVVAKAILDLKPKENDLHS